MHDPTLSPNQPPMTSSAQETVSNQNQPILKPNEVDPEKKKLWDEFRTRIDLCKGYRRKLVTGWISNIDMRRGKPFASQSDEDRVSVNLDWSLTKTKQASLFSQVPQARVNHPNLTALGPSIQSFENKVNTTLVQAGIESGMDEVLPDIINAAGFGAVLIAYEALTEDKEVPEQDLSMYPPEQVEEIMASGVLPDGTPLTMTTIPEIVDRRYTITRISPSDLLWPLNFTGSDFDNSPWIGRSGRVNWATAVQRWKLTEEDKKAVLGEDRQTLDRLTNDTDKDRNPIDDQVSFDEIFYKEFEYDPTVKSFSTIHHLVFIAGKSKPVVDEPWKGQRLDPDGLVGSMKAPIRVGTITYISDEALPPSDSAIGRPQINELNKLRTQVVLHRDRNIPVRWFDVNRVDPTVQHSLMKGTWSAMIPVQGNGQNILGEIAKSTIPQENFTFDSIAKTDLTESWSVGPNQLGSGADVETKGEGQQIENHFQTRLGRERAKIAKFFCSIAEVLGGLLCLYEDPAQFGEGFTPAISRELSYSILADSTVLLDSNQRLERLINFVNFGAKSGWVNIEPVMREIAQLSGLDPNIVIQPPQPEPPVKPNISLRLTGAEDMMNPMMLAFMLQSGQAPSAELIEQAKQLISMVVVPAPPPPPPLIETGIDGSTKAVPQQTQEATTPVLQGMQITLAPALPPADPNQAGPGEVPEPPAPEMGQANPKWNLMPKVGKRASETEGDVQ